MVWEEGRREAPSYPIGARPHPTRIQIQLSETEVTRPGSASLEIDGTPPSAPNGLTTAKKKVRGKLPVQVTWDTSGKGYGKGGKPK